MLRLFKHFKTRDWIFIVCSIGLIVGQVWLDLKLPDYLKDITMLVQTPGSAMKDIWIAGGWMLLCALGSMALTIMVGFFAARISANFTMNVRDSIFSQVQRFSLEEINRFSTASLITRSTNDVTQVQMTIAMGMQALIKAPIMAVWATIKILNKSWQWSVITGGAVVLLLLMIFVVMVFVLPRFRKIQKLTDNINNIARENLTGIRVVRAYNAESFQENKFNAANKELTHTNLVANRVLTIMHPGMMLIMNGLTLGIYWAGATIIQNGGDVLAKMNLLSDMMVFTSYAMQVMMAFVMLSMIFIMLPRAQVSAKRINEILDVKPSIIDSPNPQKSDNLVGRVEFKNVSFKYPDSEEYVLDNVSFEANMGETVAFIGSTGSGKSTLINLIPRFYDVTEGEVLVDGVDVRNYAQDDLRNKLGYVPQRGVLFSGTVMSNIDYGDCGKEIERDDVIEAVEVARGKDFVEKMDGQYDAHIAQGGTNVSGGQKQRLSIARAIARKPEIYIFDDSFSALDYKTDRDLRAALKNYTKDALSLIVAQRIGTIKNADKICVLNDGKLVGIGTHDELMKNCSVYQEIAYSQLSKEELENE